MNDTKVWYLSKTVWGSVVAGIALVAQLTLGSTISQPDQQALVNDLLGFGQGIGILMALYGRVTAKHILTSTQGTK